MDNSVLLTQTLALLQPLVPVEQLLPSEIAHISRAEQQGELHLINQFFILTGIGELRTARVISAKVEIINFLFFPETQTQLPVYAAEFVSLSTQAIIAVIDAKCLLATEIEVSISHLLQQAQCGLDISIAAEKPAWYLQSCSKNDIFVRYPSVAQMHLLKQRHLQLWQGLVSLLIQRPFCKPELIEQHQQQLHHYKKQHRLNYPGIPLLKRSFGETWTNTYLRDYLFA